MSFGEWGTKLVLDGYGINATPHIPSSHRSPGGPISPNLAGLMTAHGFPAEVINRDRPDKPNIIEGQNVWAH